jgi:hypothetical protein
MIMNILIGVAIVILALVAFIAMRPTDFRVSRAARIPAPASALFEHVNDLHKWQEWSPWAKLDPNAKITFSGPEAGQGASFHWDGNSKVGEGTMTLIESRPSDLVRFRLDFMRPFKATNEALFTFKAAGNQTDVTWTMTGRNNFMGKAFGLVMDCDKMIGKDFEKGLANLAHVTGQTAAV